MLFRYLAARWRYRGPSAKRYIRAGLGLERRAHHLSVFWGDHLSRTRAAQARWAQTCLGDVLTVLGAGPLYDFNSAPLAQKFRRFRLVDANPLAQESWGRLHVPVEPVITDISQCGDAWSTAIRQFNGTWAETLRMIEQLGSAPVAAYTSPSDGLLSLNVLSQLEIGWQELVEPILQQRFGRTFVQAREQDWLSAAGPGSRTLAQQHLAALEASSASHILLIADAEYVEYTGRRYSRERWEPVPVQWSEAGWCADAGIEYKARPALDELSLDRDLLAHWMPSYQLDWQENWLWHIAPNGIESGDFGTIHRVAAFALHSRASSPAGSTSGSTLP